MTPGNSEQLVAASHDARALGTPVQGSLFLEKSRQFLAKVEEMKKENN
ncbi:hypothetical protein [Chromobacterium vaccinii]|nr:hypothetical protein [Chromobacterium vaccinii]